jgi:hypothetical protein
MNQGYRGNGDRFTAKEMLLASYVYDLLNLASKTAKGLRSLNAGSAGALARIERGSRIIIEG